ncbi:hypothetical protein Tco_1455841 [Tanacetum coccineum]
MKPWDEGGLKDKSKELSSSLCKLTAQRGEGMVAAVVGGGHGDEASVVMMVRLVAVAWRGDGDATVVGGGVEMEMEMMMVVVRAAKGNRKESNLEFFHNLFQRDIKEMKDVFESTESELNELEKQNELLKDQLLEASLAEDIKNLVITSSDTDCNDAFGVTHELSKRIVELEKDLSKFEAKSIAFEIALQHKSRENNSLKTVQKENENFMASLQLENAHLKQTYKDLFESVQRSKVETNQCDEVKVKDNFDEIETKNIELEYRVTSLIKENEHLKLTYKNLFDSI